MILDTDSKTGAEASSSSNLWSSESQSAPPSYVHENRDREIDPIEKTPAFPVPEDHRPTYSTITSTRTYYATSSSTSGSAPTSPRHRDGLDISIPTANDALPSAFSRAPPPELSYPAFNPIFLVAQGKTVDKGFPAAPPPSSVQPHPFTSHDVGEADWLSFLNAVRSAATLTEKDVRRSYLPIISIIPIVNIIAATGVQKIMKNQKGGKVAKTIGIWNHLFFGPRKLRVILMKGQVKLSGQTELPPDGQFSPANLAPVAADDDVYRLFVVSI
ncbi:hypothetical protein GALMADRAFT_228809 [Galerina marginata CBS 339.88]|uniref:Uncharacterized protein n=1 Tax=Galerina marginata (strain CBS 339.88) TaxID=685588 RepID=A0A067SXX0_GALM3|nr:hypothetical protein GALMADRAFT_228809 [Galerina marginata CBS 339.88]